MHTSKSQKRRFSLFYNYGLFIFLPIIAVFLLSACGTQENAGQSSMMDEANQISVNEISPYGEYLVDADGRAIYLSPQITKEKAVAATINVQKFGLRF